MDLNFYSELGFGAILRMDLMPNALICEVRLMYNFENTSSRLLPLSVLKFVPQVGLKLLLRLTALTSPP